MGRDLFAVCNSACVSRSADIISNDGLGLQLTGLCGQLTVTAPGFAPVKQIIDAAHEWGVPANLDGGDWLAGQLSKDMCATIFFEVSCGMQP